MGPNNEFRQQNQQEFLQYEVGMRKDDTNLFDQHFSQSIATNSQQHPSIVQPPGSSPVGGPGGNADVQLV